MICSLRLFDALIVSLNGLDVRQTFLNRADPRIPLLLQSFGIGYLLVRCEFYDGGGFVSCIQRQSRCAIQKEGRTSLIPEDMSIEGTCEFNKEFFITEGDVGPPWDVLLSQPCLEFATGVGLPRCCFIVNPFRDTGPEHALGEIGREPPDDGL